MNREIKYRVWDGSKFYYVGNPFEEAFYTNDDDGVHFAGYVGCENPVYQQYTGLKDANGNEIYEGDIIQYNRRSSYDGMNFEVAWSEDLWGWSLVCRKSRDYLTNEMTPDGYRYKFIEIVGNIYENPELCQ